MGKRSKTAQNLPSSSEGPQHPSQQHGYQYYKNTINYTYWPKTLHLFNEITRSASHVAYYIYCCLYNERSSSRDIFFLRLLIATINFSCAPHCDDNDVWKQNKTEEMVNWLKEVKNHTATKVFGNNHEVQCVLDSVYPLDCLIELFASIRSSRILQQEKFNTSAYQNWEFVFGNRIIGCTASL